MACCRVRAPTPLSSAEREKMEEKIVNLTPHDVNVYDGDTVVYTIPTSGEVARIAEEVEACGPLYLPDGREVPCSEVHFEGIIGLPAPECGVTYIVSGMVADAAVRKDVVAPYDMVRNEKGHTIGCRQFRRVRRTR